ncbi:MAG TPA: hypothetical protein VF189_00190 [Patescibacteria group bacterium]
MKKKRIGVKNKKLRELLKKGGRENARRDFFELLKRAARTVSFLF